MVLTALRAMGRVRIGVNQTDAQSFANKPLTAECGYSECCGNPFCKAPMDARHGKRFCSDRCRMDGYVLRCARAMLDEVGDVEFNAILKEVVRP